MAPSQPHPETPWSLQPVVDWLFSEGRLIERDDDFMLELAHRLQACAAPVERMVISLLTLNPEFMAVTCSWLASNDSVHRFETERRIRETDRYIGSPLQQLYDTRKRVRQKLAELPEDAHLAYTELEQDGFTDYLALPILFAGGLGAALIVNTRREDGYSEHDIEQFRRLRDYITPTCEVHALKHLSRSLLNTYVGKRTGQKVLDGMIRRGDADVINAAIWFSDLRDFTRLTENLPAQDLLDMLNDYFEFVSAAVTARGGEILRFIGDAMLIVFPIDASICCKC